MTCLSDRGREDLGSSQPRKVRRLLAIRAAQIQADADELRQDALLNAFPEGRAYSPRALARTRLYSNEVLWGRADLRHQLPSVVQKSVPAVRIQLPPPSSPENCAELDTLAGTSKAALDRPKPARPRARQSPSEEFALRSGPNLGRLTLVRLFGLPCARAFLSD